MQNFVRDGIGALALLFDDDEKVVFSRGLSSIQHNRRRGAYAPFSVQRKSFQCAGSYQGARHSSVMFTLVQNALLNGLDVRKYIGYVFENIKKAASMESLMPYSDEMKRFRTKELIESEIK